MSANADHVDGVVARARDGDLDAFEQLVREHADSVYGHALRFFGDPHTAEDAAQEVFVRVFRSLASFQGGSAFSTWLYRVTRNTCLDMFRAGRRRPVPLDPVDIPQMGGGDVGESVVASAALEDAVSALPPEDRDAFNAVALFGLDYREAADVLNVPIGTVKSRVHRARKALVNILGLPTGEAT
jgi:RNA polymerase sigma-70 factor (ECF subfamily)